MAHGDYECCCICDSKMAYGNHDEAKTGLCAGCAVDLSQSTGKKLTDADAVLAWMKEADPMQAVILLQAAGYSECFYNNPIDIEYKAMVKRASGIVAPEAAP